MKQIAMFVGLKLVEIGGVVFVPYLLGRFGWWLWRVSGKNTFFDFWLLGSLLIFGAALLTFLTVFVIPEVIRANWRMAGKIVGRK